MAHIKTSVIRFYYFFFCIGLDYIFRSILSSFPYIHISLFGFFDSFFIRNAAFELNYKSTRHVFVDFYSSFVFIYRRSLIFMRGWFFSFSAEYQLKANAVFNGEREI